MTYIPPTGDSVGLNFTNAPITNSGGNLNLEFVTTYSANTIRQVGGISESRVGTPSVRKLWSFAYVTGIPPPPFIPPVVEKQSLKIRPSGIQSGQVGAPRLQYRQFLTASGIAPFDTLICISQVKALGGYSAPPGSSVILNWDNDTYFAPPSLSVTLEFGSIGYASIRAPTIGITGGVGSPEVTQRISIYASGIYESGVGSCVVSLNSKVILPNGIVSGNVGLPSVSKTQATDTNFMMLLF